MEDKLRRITLNQAKYLLILLDGQYPKDEYHTKAGIFGGLIRQGFIKPLGRKDRRLIWEVDKEVTQHKDLIKRIYGE